MAGKRPGDGQHVKTRRSTTAEEKRLDMTARRATGTDL